jgi:hypothetical protein
MGAELIHTVVNKVVKEGGSAILLDSFGDMKNDCTKYLEVCSLAPSYNG